MVVYLVTEGVYSNMRPIAVFTNKTLANKLVKKVDDGIRWDFTLDEHASPIKQGFGIWKVVLNETTGDVITCEEKEWDWIIDLPGGEDPRLFWAKDREHAIKMANEKLAHLKSLPQPELNDKWRTIP